jgi:lipid-A-disaccharide synthase
MKPRTKQILIVTGESSGDIHGASLSRALVSLKPDLQISGVGGVEMKKAGVHILHDNKEMAVVGVLEIFGKLGILYEIFKNIKRELSSGKYSALVLIDYPTFNMVLAYIASKNRVPVFYYCAPQIWVWGTSRVKLLIRIVNKMFVTLPFEEKLYKKAGMDVEFVGHPFLDEVKTTMDKNKACQEFGLDRNQKIIGLLPGSRDQEIQKLLPVMLDSARIIKEKFPTCQFVLPLAKTIDQKEVEDFIKPSGLEIKIITGLTYDVISVSDLLIVASGSVTLEAAILAKPMIIIYKLNFITYCLAKWVSHISNIGLVNIVAGKDVVPELHQEKVTAENISSWVIKTLTDKNYYDKVKQELMKIEKLLGSFGASQTAAKGMIRFLSDRKT